MQIEGVFFEPSDYKIIKEKEISNGPFSKVFLVQNRKNKKLYAAKILNSRDGFEGRQQMLILRECLIQHNFKYPSILSFIGASFLSLSKPSIFEPTIITEYMKNGSLGNILKKEKEKKIDTIYNCTKKYIILLGVSDAMRFLHENSIIHRDLKPDNILIDENYYPKISDFGLARLMPEKMESIKMTECIGTPMYMAPEMLTDDNDEIFSYDQSIDVYAFGIIAYEIVTGNQPFSELGEITPIKLSFKIIDGYRPKFNDNVTEKMKTLISRCWNGNTKERPSFKEIFETLSTDFSYFKEKIDQKEVKDFIDYLEREKNKTKSIINKTSKGKNDDDKDFDINEENLDEEDDDDDENDDDENEKIALFQDKSNLISYKLYEKTRTAEIIDSPNVKANVIIPENVKFGFNTYEVTKICDKAFSGSSIEDLKFSPNSKIKEIGDFSFEGSELKRICIPKSLKILGKFWSKGTIKLENIEIDPNNHHFSKNGDFMINKITSEVLFVSRNFQGNLKIPEETTSIGDYSFTDHRGIFSFISLAPSLNRIGSYSFSKCSNLKSITISQNGPKLTLESFCFSDATNLSSFEISCNMLEIQNNCFYNCNHLTSFKVIKSNEIEIHSKSFSGCNALQSISFDDSSDIKIGHKSFKCKDQLKTVSFGKVNKVYIFQKAFYNCRNLESISIENSSEINIQKECFCESNRLKSIKLIANSVKFDKSFVKNCISLSNVYIQSKEGGIQINSETFYSCQLIKVIVYSPNLRFYPLCFNGQKNLEKIEIESKNLELSRCFNNCNSLKSLSLKIENQLAVTNDLLNGCTSIESLTIDVQSRLTIPNDFMKGSKNLLNVVLKGNEVVIGNSCFANCTELKQFTIVDSGSINIGNNLFENCKKLEKITIGHKPKSASRIEFNNTCFNKAENLKEFKLLGGNVKLINTGSKFCSSLTNLFINDANRVEINDKQFQSLKSLQHVVIESKSDVILGSECFYDSNKLETVAIVGSNIFISNRCFVNCNSLSKLDILNGTDLTLGSNVVNKCSKLEELKFNIKQVKLEEKCFNESSIKNVEINGESVIIKNECFKNLSSLRSIKIISKNIQLERNSFEGCKNLDSISLISEMRLKIGENCFYNNNRIALIELEGNIIEIESYCFYNCASIRALNLTCNDKITLGNNAFECCTNINNIFVFAKNEFTAGDHCFLNANNIRDIQITSKKVLLNDFCFSKCSQLTTFSILNGEDVSFKNKIFDSCKLLTTVRVVANVNFNANNYCFQNLSNLRNVIINSSHIVFLSYCFEKCNSLRNIDCRLANSIEYCNSSLNGKGTEFIRTEGSATLSKREENIDSECTIQ